jgi:hypothetical protein
MSLGVKCDMATVTVRARTCILCISGLGSLAVNVASRSYPNQGGGRT